MAWKELSRPSEINREGLSTNEAILLLQQNNAFTWFVKPDKVWVFVATGEGDWFFAEDATLIGVVLKHRRGEVRRLKLTTLPPGLKHPLESKPDGA